MLSDANREIRSQIARSVERRLRRPDHVVAFEYVDQLIEALEELHMRDHVIVPGSFDKRLRTLERMLPPGTRRPRIWPTSIRRLLDACFDVQQELLLRRSREQALRQVSMDDRGLRSELLQ